MDAHRRSHGMPSGDQATIAALAEETHTERAVVQDLYDEEFAALEARSSIKTFIPVIAARRVKERLRAPQHTDTARQAHHRAERRSHA